MLKRKSNYGNKRVYFVFPYLALSIVFVIVPLLFVFGYAFVGADGGFSFENFARFSDADIWLTIGDTFLVAFLTTGICLLLSYPLALALLQTKANRTAVLVMLFVLPMWINSLLRIISIRLFFENIIEPGYGLMLIGMVYDFFPFMLLPIYTILANTDKSVVEAAGDLGASPLQTLVKVRLPLSVPGIVSGVLMVFMPTMSTFAVSRFLSDNTITLFGNLIETSFDSNSGWPAGSAYSIVLMILIAMFVLGATKLSKGKASAASGGTV